MIALTADNIVEELNRIIAIDNEAFNKISGALYESSITWKTVHWRGRPLVKWPSDLWVYMELIQMTRPQVIVETGTYEGGSAMFFADMQKVFGIEGMVITVDNDVNKPTPPLPILSLRGDSVSDEILRQVEKHTKGCPAVLVSLDSDHTYEHVKKELDAYSKFVPLGSCLVVEDMNVSQLIEEGGSKEGPQRAAEEFLHKNVGVWARNIGCERFVFGFNSGGWMIRTGA